MSQTEDRAPCSPTPTTGIPLATLGPTARPQHSPHSARSGLPLHLQGRVTFHPADCRVYFRPIHHHHTPLLPMGFDKDALVLHFLRPKFMGIECQRCNSKVPLTLALQKWVSENYGHDSLSKTFSMAFADSHMKIHQCEFYGF